MISKAGYLPFGQGPGDHRGLFVDINLQNLVGGDFHKIHRQQARRLISHDSRVTERFDLLFQQQLDRNSVSERIAYLSTIPKHKFTQKHEKEYEKLDRLQMCAFQYANKRCRKLRFGEVAFAPAAAQLVGRKAHLGTLVIRRKSGCPVSSSTIKRLGEKCEILHPLKMSVEEAKTLRANAWKEYNRLKPNRGSI